MDGGVAPTVFLNANAAMDDRVPLVLTYNLFSTRTRQTMINNLNILTTHPETCRIFPELPLVSYRRDRNLSDILVHSVQNSSHPQMLELHPVVIPIAKRASTWHLTLLRMLCTESPVRAAPAFTLVTLADGYRSALGRALTKYSQMIYRVSHGRPFQLRCSFSG